LIADGDSAVAALFVVSLSHRGISVGCAEAAVSQSRIRTAVSVCVAPLGARPSAPRGSRQEGGRRCDHGDWPARF